MLNRDDAPEYMRMMRIKKDEDMGVKAELVAARVEPKGESVAD